jgi:hypothetical protein
MSDDEQGSLLTGRFVAGAEPALVAFLKDRVNTFVKWDLVHFFHANPNTSDTPENTARYIGRNPDEVRAALETLAADGLLAAQALGGMPVYRLTEDAEARALVTRFVEACADRQFRLRAIYHLVRAERE